MWMNVMNVNENQWYRLILNEIIINDNDICYKRM